MTKEHVEMSKQRPQVGTAVHPADGGEAVKYPECEIDEVDRDGNLRLTSLPCGHSEEGRQYVVWAAGTWQRAETLTAHS